MHPPRNKACARWVRWDLLAILLFLPSVFFGQDGAPVDPRDLLSSLAVIKQKQAAASTSQRNTIYQDFRAASGDNASALAFYQEAMRNTAFNGQNREQTEFHEWKKKQADKFKDPAFQNALRLHLAYIVLTLERGNGVEIKKLEPELLDYLTQAGEAGDSLKDPFMKDEITRSIFVNWYQIGSWISSAQDWDMKPGDINGIYDKTILPEMRAVKDPRLIEYWDNRMTTEAQAATDTKLTFEINKYNQITRPALLWSRAGDLIVLGQKNNAVRAMLDVIKENPDHPSASDWVAQLQGILQSLVPPPSPVPSPAAPAPPAPSPGAPPAPPPAGTP